MGGMKSGAGEDPFEESDEADSGAHGAPTARESRASSEAVVQEPPEPEADEGGPAFPYDPSLQQAVYPRKGTWSDYVATRMEVQARLRRSHDLDDVEKREVDDAVLRLAEEHPDLVEAAIVDARGLEEDS